jgi:hypothetical protein
MRTPKWRFSAFKGVRPIGFDVFERLQSAAQQR